jgi:glycosyltransferase involved in cell wall biosynthesis
MMIEARALQRMSAVVCVSESVQSFVKDQQHVRTPLQVIPNSIELSEWDEGVDDSEDESSTLLFVGRLHPQKGLELLFEALPSLLADHPDMNVMIVGDGPLRNWVVDLAAAISSERIAVTGWRSDVKVLMKRCRLLVLPSRYEGMPNVVMEAMASSRPVAVARVEGVNELLRDVANDQTFEPGDAKAFGTLIDRLWRDRELSSSLGKRNRELVAANHSRVSTLDAYQTLYRNLLAGEKGA